MHGGAEPERAADAERAFEAPGEQRNDALENAPIEQKRGQRADDEHERKGAEGENIARARIGLGEGQGRAAEIAEDEGGSGVGGLLQAADRGIEEKKGLGRRLEFDEEQGKPDLQQHAAENDAPWRRRALFAQEPSDEEEGKQPQEAMQEREQDRHSSSRRYLALPAKSMPRQEGRSKRDEARNDSRAEDGTPARPRTTINTDDDQKVTIRMSL